MWRAGLLFALGFPLNPTVAVTALVWLDPALPPGIDEFVNNRFDWDMLAWVVSVHVAVFLGVVGYLVDMRTWFHALSWVAVGWCVWTVYWWLMLSWSIGHGLSIGWLGPGMSFRQVVLAEWPFVVIVIIGLAVGIIMGRVGRKWKSRRLTSI